MILSLLICGMLSGAAVSSDAAVSGASEVVSDALEVVSDASAAVSYDEFFTGERLRVDVVLAGNSEVQTCYVDALFRESQWSGTTCKLVDPFDYGQYKLEVYHDTQLIYSRGFNTLFEEWRVTSQAQQLSMATGQSLWMPFPKAPVHLVISQRIHDTGKFEVMTQFDVDPADRHIAPAATDYKTVPYMVNGPVAEKVDMVIVAEGYRSCQMRAFRRDARRMLDYFFSMEPYASRKSDFNVWLVESPSEDSGVTIPQEGKWRNTVIGASFDTFYIDRYLTIMDHRRIAAAVSSAPCDAVVVLANDDKYGGGGFYNSYAMATGSNKWSEQVFIHEFGHSFAGLGDEYFEAGTDEFDDFYPRYLEPWEPNVTTLVDFASKWEDMMGVDGVGLYEGAGYMPRGCWRPVPECRMLNNTAPEFCPVCRRAISRMIDYYCGEVTAAGK